MNVARWIGIGLLLFGIGAKADQPDKHGHVHAPKHGGVVSEYRNLELELVAQADVIRLYVRETASGKPIDVSKARAKLTLLTGKDKQEVEMAPAGDKLEAKGQFKVGKGTKAVAVVSNPGSRDATARFALK